MLLSLQDVTQRFGGLAAVDGVSLEVEEGEILGIAGPNGAGKTTLFNTVCGFHRPQGRIELDGVRIDGLRPHRVCRLGLARLFQIPAPFASMTVRQNVDVGSVFGGGRRRPHAVVRGVDSAMEWVGIRDKADETVSTLRLYDKKLTLLAAALATSPRVLLLDEVAAGLSAVEVRGTLEILRRLSGDAGITLLVIEHVMGILTELCNRLLIMNDGRIIASGQPNTIMGNREVREVLLG